MIANNRNPRRHRARPASCLTGLVLFCLLLTGALQARAETDPRVRLVTTSGTIDVQLFPDKAPQTVANFLRLVDDGFYDGLIFHRVIANFMIQTGGYDAAMNYREAPASVPNESFNGLRNRPGKLAMARLADPDSADSQFFINVNHNTHLDAAPGQPGYTVFGQVVAGMDVVTDIELSDTGRQAGMAGVPETPIVVERAKRLP
ncbi:MAG: peptidylprolyl isomerase [Pseudomonadales bacterium]